ncbi:MAG: hypothetical protein A2X32_03020 [Elusimicrobia bacterium GWC2_64_44]|nr:MAG: hypothetical protein A2X32_03020 [Elusimicrobia bacterium GWC2_64_44]
MEEQVSHISDLEGLNSELDGFLADLHGREETLAARVKTLEEELKGARASAGAELGRLAQKEAALSSAMEDLRTTLARESSAAVSLASERDELLRRLDVASRQLAEARSVLAAKEASLQETREAMKAREAELSAAVKEARASSKEEAAKLSAAAEEARAALAKESAKFSAAVLDRDDFARRAEAANEILNEARTALAEKDALLKETRTAAREKAAELASALDKANSALHDEAAKVSGLLSERDVLLRRLEALAAGLEEEKNGSAKKEAQLKEARAAAKDKAAELTAGLEQVRAALREESAKAAELASVRDALLRQLADSADLLQEEKKDSAKKDEALAEVREAAKNKNSEFSAALKGKDEELGRTLRGLEDLRADLTLERANVKDREAQLQKAARLREGLEKKLELSAQENSRSEEGYLLKLELVKKELREQAKRAEELERKLAAAGARLDDALEEAAKKEKLLSELSAALTAKDAQLKEAGAKLSALASDYAKLKDGSGHENAERARQLAASMAARVEELENTLAQAAERHLEKYRSVQAELSGARAEIRSREEENAALRAREDTISKELGDAEEKWKFASAQLHNSASKLRNSENELEILSGRLRSLEEERDKFRAAAIKAETAAAGMAARESKARDGEAAGLMAALEEQAAKYTDLLRKYDDVALLNETLAREKAGLKAEADSLRGALTAAQASADAEAGEKRGVQSSLAERLRAAEAQLKKKDFELEAARAEASAAELEAEELRASLDEAETSAAGEAEAEKVRYAALSERVHNADALLKKKEFELEEARGSLSGLEQECSLLRSSRASLGEKYAREIQAENELLKEAQAKILERDSVISRLSTAEEAIKGEAEALKRERQGLLALVRKKAAGGAHSAKVSEAERLLKEKESRLEKLRAELENTRAEKAELQGREKELREELKARPYRAMLRESEEKLLIKEKMLADLGARMKRIGHDFEELKARGQSAGAPGYLPEFEELVAGVAHQVANSISIIRSHAEFCSEAPDSEGARESLDVIVRNIVNLQKKIDIIMNFSRPVIPQRSPERLAAVVAEVLQGLRAAGKLEKIVVSVKGGEKLKPVGLDRVRFASAVEQLLLNAAEALPSGGELSVSVSAAGGRQRIEICDTGAGIERKNLASAFHPFFTTKPGKMGLGLTLARNVARAHGGALELFSEPGKGTRAVLELPES